MRSILNFLGVVLLSSLIFSEKTWASACSTVTWGNIATTVSLDANQAPDVSIVISRNSGGSNQGTCDFFIVVDEGGAANYANRYLDIFGNSINYPFQIYQDSGHTVAARPLSSATQPTVISGTFSGSNTSVTVHYYPKIDTSIGMYQSGFYANQFTYTLYTGSVSGGRNFVSNRSVNFTYNNPIVANLSVVDTGAPFSAADVTQTMNFGALTSNASKSCDVVLQYNSGYQLDMLTANGTSGGVNRIKNANGNTISYTLRVNGAVKSVGTFYTSVATSSNGGGADGHQAANPVSPAGGTRIPVSVTIGNVAANAQSGTYTDTVTIRISAL